MSLKRRHGCPGSPVAVPSIVLDEQQVWRAHIDRFPCGEPVGYPDGGVA